MSSSEGRVLVVTPFPPRRDAGHGGSRVMAESICHLAGRFDVALLTLRADTEDGVEEDVARRCALVEEVVRSPVGSPRSLWRERRRLSLAARGLPGWAVGHAVADAATRLDGIARSWQPDVVQLEFLVLGPLARTIARPRPPVVVVDHDARPALASGRAAGWGRLRRYAAGGVDAFVVFTEADRAVVAADVDGVPVEVIPPGLDLPGSPSGLGGGEDVLFVGGFAHPPNLEAARRLVRTIHPLVRATVPSATLTLVGAAPPDDLAAGAGVVALGRVADLAPILDRAAVCVAPLAEGGGMRIKVLDALAAGKAVVASARAVEGLTVRDGEHLLLADSDDATADAIVRLLRDAPLRIRLGTAARAWAERSLGWGAPIDSYAALYRRLGARGGPR